LAEKEGDRTFVHRLGEDTKSAIAVRKEASEIATLGARAGRAREGRISSIENVQMIGRHAAKIVAENYREGSL